MMAKKKKRFETKLTEGLYQVVVDKETGVQYLVIGAVSGITPLLDSDGKLLLAKEEAEE